MPGISHEISHEIFVTISGGQLYILLLFSFDTCKNWISEIEARGHLPNNITETVWARFHWLQIHFLTTLLYCLPRQHDWFFSNVGLQKDKITSGLPMGTQLGRVCLYMHECFRAVVLVQLNRSLSISFGGFCIPGTVLGLGIRAEMKQTQFCFRGALSFLFGLGHWLSAFQCSLSCTWPWVWLLRFKHLSVWK